MLGNKKIYTIRNVNLFTGNKKTYTGSKLSENKLSYDQAKEFLEKYASGPWHIQPEKRQDGLYYTKIRWKGGDPSPPVKCFSIDRRLLPAEVEVLQDLAEEARQRKGNPLGIPQWASLGLPQGKENLGKSSLGKDLSPNSKDAIEKLINAVKEINDRMTDFCERLEILEKKFGSSTSSSPTIPTSPNINNEELAKVYTEVQRQMSKMQRMEIMTMAYRLITDPQILLYYAFAKSHIDPKITIDDFIRTSIVNYFAIHGIRLAFIIGVQPPEGGGT